ncbi:MAG: leucine-rich repeat protein [Paramuribaculum sp.]|nr:leucine-rich repeat protein [Paramuribaculum sp.]
MKKIITILGLALSAIVLSNTAFANNLIVDTVSVPQRHIRAYNTTQYAPDSLSSFVWYFIMDDSDSTAILTFPGKFHNISDPNESGFAYDSVALNRFFGWEGIWNQNMYNCWSEVIEKKSPGSNDLFYTALRIPDKFVYDGIPYTVTEIGDSAFMNSPINYIDVPETVERIGKHAFANSKIIGQCEASPYQVIPNSVKYLGEGIFLNCDSLSRIEFGDGVTVIPENTFDGCFVTDQDSPNFIKTLDIRFGRNIESIKCDIKIPEIEYVGDKPVIRVAFSSPELNDTTIIGDFKPTEIWYPENYTLYAKIFENFNVHPYSITPEKSEYEVEYSKLPLKLNFTQKSYFNNPNSVYNYIYYYPAGGGINFSVNALTGRGANKVRFRMLFDSLDHVWQANKVYQIIRQDTATSYAYLDFNATDTVYEVTVRSLDFTRAEAKVKIRVSGTIPIQKVNIYKKSKLINNSTDSLAIGKHMEISYTVTDRKDGISYNQDAIWTTSNDTIATVNQDGVVTALKPGKVDVIATSLDPSASNISGKFTIIVFDPKQKTPVAPQAAAIDIENQIAVTTSGKELTIRSNAPLGKVDIYSLDGRLVKSINSSMNVETINLSNSGIYIVKTLTQTVKVKL